MRAKAIALMVLGILLLAQDNPQQGPQITQFNIYPNVSVQRQKNAY
jgi:hypothetical protein